MMKYIAELFQTNQWSPKLAIADGVYSRQYNIYAFSVAPLVTVETDPTNYWIVWGGYFDNPVGYGLQVYMGQFLTEVFLPANLIATENSFYIDEANNICYMNIPQNPWRYFTEYASVYANVSSTFASAPKNENNPSDIWYDITRAEPRLEIPSVENGLNDVISGVSVYNGFSITVDNHDGLYDGMEILNYFNTPLQVSKSSTNAQTISAFERIRYGIVSDINVAFEKMVITAEDTFYVMVKEYCRKFSADEFANIEAGTINDDIPVGWGALEGVEPIEVDKDTADPPLWIDYIALDKSHITSVQGVYDKDGNSLTYTFTALTGIIRVTELDVDGEVIEAEYMNVTGKTACSIGEIVIDALDYNENISYTEGIWDVTETDLYLTYCPDVSIYFDGGTTRELLEKVLKNDMAYLIQKNDGRLTLRRWGQVYNNHQFESWVVTQKPKKNFKDATKYFCSTSKVLYDKFESTGNYQMSYLNDADERVIFQKTRKSYQADFETDFRTATPAQDLALRVIERFGTVRETVEIGLGVDTFEIDLLDTVDIIMTVNDRQFSPYFRWVVKKCDPGQDVLTMEGQEIFNFLTFDSIPASLDDVQFIVQTGE